MILIIGKLVKKNINKSISMINMDKSTFMKNGFPRVFGITPRKIHAWLIGLLGGFLLSNTTLAIEPSTFERINKLIAEYNAVEIAERTDYYNYLVREKDEKGSLQKHLDSYASLSMFGAAVPEEAIKSINPALPFPADLLAFYRTYGWFTGGDALQMLAIYSPEPLLKKLKGQYNYQKFFSLGLLDMINYQWGNSREELDMKHKNAIFTQQQFDYLNTNYIVVAAWEDYSWGSEAHYYIYYDKDGRFGIFHLHQDTWEISHLFEGSPAKYSWDQVVNEALDIILAANDDY